MQLCKSHIIPELFYKKLYDSKHRAVGIHSEGYIEIIQKGIRERLLCKKCEGYISKKIETPFEKQWKTVLPKSYSYDILELSGLNYTVTKLMVLTNLWRAHCSKLEIYESVKLGPYAEKIKKMITELNPGDESKFPMWGQLVVDKDNKVHADIITPYTQSKLHGNHMYYAIALLPSILDIKGLDIC